jgi:hypothetical protein
MVALVRTSLIYFPDFAQVSSTLETVVLNYNQISFIRWDDVRNRNQLKTFYLKDVALEFITEQLMQLPSLATLDLRDSVLPCCHSTAWIRDIQGSPALTDGVSCSAATSLDGWMLESTTKDQLSAVACSELILFFAKEKRKALISSYLEF